MNLDESKIEELDADDAKIAQMLAGLRRVDAPANFEFQLKARIANAKRPPRGIGFLPSLVKYAAPLTLVAVVSSFFYLNSSNPTDQSGLSSAGVTPRAPQIVEVANTAILPIEPSDAVESELSVSAPRSKRPSGARSGKLRTEIKTSNEPDRSKVIAVSPPRIILPRGINPNGIPVNAQIAPETNVSRTAAAVFPMLGIDAGYGDEGWKVRAVKVNSPADKAGLKAGDVLEAIDENQLGKDAVFKSGFNGKVMKVRRDGKVVELTLVNK